MINKVNTYQADPEALNSQSISFLLEISKLSMLKGENRLLFSTLYNVIENFVPYFSRYNFRSKHAIEFAEKVHLNNASFSIKKGSHFVYNVVFLLYALIDGKPKDRRQAIMLAQRMRLNGIDYLRLKYLLSALGYDEEIVVNFLSYYDDEQAWSTVEAMCEDVIEQSRYEPTRASFVDFYTNQLTRYPAAQVHYPIAKKKDKLLDLKLRNESKEKKIENKKPTQVSPAVENVVFFISRSFNKDKPLWTNSHYTSLKIFLKLIEALNISGKYNIKSYFSVSMERYQSSQGLLNTVDYKEERDFSYLIFEELRKECPSLVGCHIPSQTCDTLDSRLRSVLSWLGELHNPKLIFLGGTFDSPSLRKCAYGVHPITLLPTTSNLTTAYGSLDHYFDSVRAITPHHLEKIKSLGLSYAEVVHFPKPMYQADFDDTRKSVFKTWQELGIEAVNSSNVLLTPLTGSRVVGWLKSIPDEIIEQLVHALEKFDSQWVIVGLNIESFEFYAKTQPVINRAYVENKIVLVPFTDSLVDVIYNSSTMFVPTQGAGTTLAKAILLDKLVLVPDGSDAQSVICEELIFNNAKQAVDKLEQLLSGSDVRGLIEKNTALIKYRFDTSMISKEFYSLLEKASLNFNEKVIKNV
ncbi:hypothetical protein P4544_13910 [Halomonas sp. LY9]